MGRGRVRLGIQAEGWGFWGDFFLEPKNEAQISGFAVAKKAPSH